MALTRPVFSSPCAMPARRAMLPPDGARALSRTRMRDALLAALLCGTVRGDDACPSGFCVVAPLVALTGKRCSSAPTSVHLYELHSTWRRHAAPPSCRPTLCLRTSEPVCLCAAPRRHACRALALATTAHAPRPHVAGERDGHRDGLQWRERGARTCAAQYLALVRRRACRRRPRSPPTAPHPGTVPALLISAREGRYIRRGGCRAGGLYETRYA